MLKDWYLQITEQFPDPFSWGYTSVGAGWNAGFHLEDFLRFAGYDPEDKVGEDLHIRNIFMVGHSKEEDEQGNPIPNGDVIKTMPTYSEGSMRRFLMGLIRSDVYSRFGDPYLEKKIRTASEEELLEMLEMYEYINDQNVETFTNILSYHIRLFFNILPNNPDEAKRRSKIYLTLFHLRENEDYNFDEKNRRITLTKNGMMRLKFLFELFKVFLSKYEIKDLRRMKLGIWPIWSGFKVPIEDGKGNFELIEIIGEQLGVQKKEGENFNEQIERENQIIEAFLNSDYERKLEIIENIIKLKLRRIMK